VDGEVPEIDIVEVKQNCYQEKDRDYEDDSPEDEALNSGLFSQTRNLFPCEKNYF